MLMLSPYGRARLAQRFVGFLVPAGGGDGAVRFQDAGGTASEAVPVLGETGSVNHLVSTLRGRRPL
jgi:hypothetical protein